MLWVVAFPKATSVCKNLLSCHHRFSECRCDLSNVNKHVSHTFVSLFSSNFVVSFVSWDCVFIGIFMTLFCHVVQHHTSAVILELHLLSSSSACRTSLGFLHTPLLFFCPSHLVVLMCVSLSQAFEGCLRVCGSRRRQYTRFLFCLSWSLSCSLLLVV